MSTPAYLILANGKIFKGKSFGASGTVIAETVFTTAMTGYLETLTDKSYFGQTVVQAFPLIGNYGVIHEDFESETVAMSGYIVRRWCHDPSNFRSEGALDAFLKQRNIIGLWDIDTRALVRIIRESGVMNGMITTDDPANADLERIAAYRVTDAVKSVSTDKPYFVKAENEKCTVVLLDFGEKANIKRSLLKRGASVWVVPYNTSAADIIKLKPDGIMLSNGPGDPAENTEVIANLALLSKSGIPIFGICLGHQLLALANGFKTYKLKYGHRSANQPVRDINTGKIYITSQNHGYAVDSDSIDGSIAAPLFDNVNDLTNEGITYKNMPAFTVQFHPEAYAGPRDTSYLFDEFVKMLNK